MTAPEHFMTSRKEPPFPWHKGWNFNHTGSRLSERPMASAHRVERGSIQYIFNYPGDPLTPGAPSKLGIPRIDPDDAKNMPTIPTAPMSYGDARRLLKAMRGPRAPKSFQGGLRFPHRVGPGPAEARLALDIAYRRTPPCTT